MARRFIRRPMRNLASNQRGSVIIELAFIAPILATMIVGVVDLSAAYGRKLVLEQAAQRAVATRRRRRREFPSAR
jgi:Flp pilus assembly protein TadG